MQSSIDGKKEKELSNRYKSPTGPRVVIFFSICTIFFFLGNNIHLLFLWKSVEKIVKINFRYLLIIFKVTKKSQREKSPKSFFEYNKLSALNNIQYMYRILSKYIFSKCSLCTIFFAEILIFVQRSNGLKSLKFQRSKI